jgi:hypothetical protein
MSTLCLAPEGGVRALSARFERGAFAGIINNSRSVPCSLIHGDLNPRNFLVDGAENIHVIDFSTLKEGPTAKDFVRLEAELLLMLPQVVTCAEFSSLCTLLLGAIPADAAAVLASAPLGLPVRRVVESVAAIRAQLSRACDCAIDPVEYYASLALTATRIALFDDYLTPSSSFAALLLATLAADAAAREPHCSTG